MISFRKSQSFIISEESEKFNSIHSPHINFILQKRNIENHLDEWKKNLNWDKTEMLEAELDEESLADFEKDLCSELTSWTKEPHELAIWVSQDMTRNIRNFMKFSKAKEVMVKVEPVNTDKCRYYHADYNNLRMLCTYVGEGTHWVPVEKITPEKIIKINKGEITLSRDEFNIVPTLDIALLKGDIWNESQIGGAIHRSPSLKQGRRRVLLKVDFIN